jgi:hypothetical protein
MIRLSIDTSAKLERLTSTDSNEPRPAQSPIHTSPDPHSSDAGERSSVLLNVTEQRARRAHQEALLDEAIEETFLASDPNSPACMKQDQ